MQPLCAVRLDDVLQEQGLTLAGLYDRYQSQPLRLTHIRPQDLDAQWQTLSNHPLWRVSALGHSAEGRLIRQCQFGSGPLHIAAWSQMHGDEPTATASLFDLIHTLNAPELAPWIAWLSQQITLTLVPMLNPDGAQAVTRQNAQGLDINRDARALQTPEGRLLQQLLHRQPDLAFNLHDMDRYHAADGKTPVNLALMAPAADPQRSVTPARLKAMQLCGAFLARQQGTHAVFARYDDTYSVRGFGDYASSLGIPTLLVEACCGRGDWQRQTARYLTWQLMVGSLDGVDHADDVAGCERHYLALPENHADCLCDLLIRDVCVADAGHEYRVDVLIQRNFVSAQAAITFVGDGADEQGLCELHGKGLTWQPLTVSDVAHLGSVIDGIAIHPSRLPHESVPRIGPANGKLQQNGETVWYLLEGELFRAHSGERLCHWPHAITPTTA